MLVFVVLSAVAFGFAGVQIVLLGRQARRDVAAQSSHHDL